MNISTLSRACAVLSASLFLAACSSSHEGLSSQVAPGTASLPVLSADEAANFTTKNYLAFGGPSLQVQKQGWFPKLASTDGVKTDFVVGPQLGTDGAAYTNVQLAVNAALAVRNHGERIFIKILPGTYNGAVYIPAGSPPVTLFGAGTSPSDVTLSQGLEAASTPATYRATVSPNGQFLPGDRAFYMYKNCATLTTDTIGTGCSATVWSQSNGLQLQNLTIGNATLDTVDAGDHSAVALRTDGDNVVIDNVRLIGRQNTYMVNTANIHNETDNNRYSRAYVHNSLIVGDVDYVFGRALAVFDHVEFHTVSSRGVKEASVFAPNTPANAPYGFLVIDSNLTGDRGFEQAAKAKMGRAWDVDGASSQLVIRDSSFDNSYDQMNPWGAAAFSGRPFAGNVPKDEKQQRNLNDTNFNRLWQYNNVLTQPAK
ncbi:putative acyl-CoA thioester hydrolase [Rahnella sp. R3(2024)]|uniref:putative acyl-CoA thioester hydrolase n=1 Tax=Rahnella sp. R3(2024) TaxID=3163550 RepID=UPI001613E904|nr:pectinesterase [Rahnella inusitata]